MKIKHRIYMVDVFAEHAYTGNPLAVVIGSEDLPEITMQRIAAEMNFSETTFVASSPDADGRYPVRIFTPAREIEFAGHPILGTAWVIRHHIAAGACSRVDLMLAVGQVPVWFESSGDAKESAWFRAPPMSMGAIAPRDPIATALGLAPQDIETNMPIQTITAGTSAMVVPICTSEALHRAKLNLELFAALAAEGFPPLVYLFCNQPLRPENDLRARFFFEAHGVREDPATGNGAAFLGAYLLQYCNPPGTDLSLRIEQGHEVHRPSLVMLRARMNGDVREVSVGGHVVQTLQGELL